MIAELEELMKDQKGTLSFKFKVIDSAANFSVDLISKKFKVEANSEILDRLEKIHPLRVQLN